MNKTHIYYEEAKLVFKCLARSETTALHAGAECPFVSSNIPINIHLSLNTKAQPPIVYKKEERELNPSGIN